MKLEVQITADSLRIRSGPSTSFDTVGYLYKDDVVTVDEISDDGAFYHMYWGQGWIGVKYATVINNLEAEDTAVETTDTSPLPEDTSPATVIEDPPLTTFAQPTAVVKDYTKIHNIIVEGDTISDAYSYQTDISDASGITDAEVLGTIINDSGFPATIISGNAEIVDYTIDYDYLKDNLAVIRNNMNIVNTNYKQTRDDLFDKFNRFRTVFPDLQLSKSFSYVFFTRPDLNIYSAKGNGVYELNSNFTDDPVYYYLDKNNKKLLMSLTKDFTADHDFLPFLSNSAESFELSDEFLKTVEHGETFTGYKIQYGRHNIESNSAGTFSVAYTDDAEFSIYKLHKAWIDYIAKVYRGVVSPRDEYIPKKILDYACSAYYFICGPDGETILFWSKYFGVFPTNTPASSSSWSKGSMVKIPQFNINYSYAFKEDFSPLSLAEFNMNSSTSYTYRKTYEPQLLSTGKTMSGAPFVETVKNSLGEYEYKLRFRKS